MSLIRYVTRIHFADRAMEDALPEELRARRLAAPLILADSDAGEALPRLLECLPPGARPRVLEIGPAATASDALADRMSGDAADCDLVIGLGGAEAIDLARMARPGVPPSISSIRAAQPRPLPGREPRRASEPGFDPLTTAVPRMAIPTLPGCLGLGPVRTRAVPSGPVGAVTEIAAPVPCVLFCDPVLMKYASPERLAEAGMDALVHCLEALLSTAWNPPADGMAFDGLRRAGAWLERLCADPADPEARREVMAAALNGALAAQKGLGAVHALSGAFESLSLSSRGHGGLHAALLGPALDFNAPAVPGRMAQAAEALHLADPSQLPAHLRDMGVRLGLPARLSDLGLTAAGIARLAECAAGDPANRSNPRLATARDYAAMIEAAI
jgi:4-hydroxybutyrate dehydrogenase